MSFVSAGTKLQGNFGAGLVDIAEVVDTDGPEHSIGEIDNSNLQTANVAKTFLPGWIDAGSVTLEANFTPAQLATFLANLRVVLVWRVLLSNGSHWDFSGFISKVGTKTPLEGLIQMPFAIKVSGLPTFTQ